MKMLVVAPLLSLGMGTALAAANCPQYPKADWMPPDEAKARIEAMGYKIAKFKVDGNCYEIYGENKEGKKTEVYFDAKTLQIVKAEVRK
jgi:hypothetical protein